MEKPDYYAALGLPRHATAADIEASYLALTQFLDPRSVPPGLRGWAEAQVALIDEAYAALTDLGDEEPEAKEAVRAPQGAAQALQGGRGGAATAVHRPEVREYDDEYDDDEEYEELEEDYDLPPRREQSRPAAAAPKKGQPVAQSKAAPSQERARWEQRGRKRGRGRQPAVVAPQPAPSGWLADDRIKKMVIGLGAGLVIVVAAFFAVQSGLLPFGSNGDQQGTDQPAQFDQARYATLQNMLQRDPTNYAVLFELGEMNFQSQRYPESIQWFEKLLEVKPDDVHAMQDIGTANFNMGNLDKAKEMWLRALTADPNDAQTHWNLSFLYASLQPPDIDAAMQEWQRVIDLAPDSELAQTAKAHLDQYKARQGSATPAPTPPQ